MKPYEIKCLIFIIISILYLYSNSYKKETFANLDTFIQNTNNGNWNFNSYNPYANLNEYIDSFYIINTTIANIELMSYKERLESYKEQLTNLKNDVSIKPLVENKLNTYNNTTNITIYDDPKITKFGLKYTYKVPLITAFDKLNYVKNKAKLKNLINTSLIKDLRTSFINKYIKKGTITNQPDGEGNINVELKYNIENGMIFSTDSTYRKEILNKIKEYLKMDIQDNGTTIGNGSDGNTTILIYFKIITYNLDEANKEIITNKVKNLHNILFTDLLNTNDTDNILEKMTLANNETYIKNICIWKSGLCKRNTDITITPYCSVPRGDKTILNTYKIERSSGLFNITDKTTVINLLNSTQLYDCKEPDLEYNTDGSFTLKLYDSAIIDANTIQPLFSGNSITVTRESQTATSTCSAPNINGNSIDAYMSSLQSIKGLDPIMQDKVKSILLADLDLTAFNNYKMGKSTKDINKYKKLRLYGIVYKLLDKYKNIDIITNAIKKELDSKAEEEAENDITKSKLYAVLHLIIEQHLRNSNEEFKLNELLLTNNNNSTKKRYEVILDYIPKTDETKSMKLKEMSSLEKVKYFDKTTKGINKIELEMKLIETMNNDELTAYFNDINTLYKTQDVDKDVNARLKRLITKNKNNIIRIHKKLHAISGGLIKQTGGDLILKNETIVNNSQDNTDTLLLLHNYKNYSLNIPLNINGIAKYENKLYIIGNSGYLATYDLTEGKAQSISVNPSKGANLNSISINSGKCVIVGNNGTLLYRDLTGTENFRAKDITNKSNLNEVFVDTANVYIAGDNILYKTTYVDISTDSTAISKITNVPNAKYFNIIKHGSDFYCMGKAATDDTAYNVINGDIVIYHLSTSKINKITSPNLHPIFLETHDSKLKLIYKETNTSTSTSTTHICTITPDSSSAVNNAIAINKTNPQPINILSTDKIDTCFIEKSVLFIIAITDNGRTKFYDYTIKQDDTLTPSTDPSDRFKILSKKMFNNKITILPDNFDSSINLLHYGSGGNIFNYSMNTKYKDFSLNLTAGGSDFYPTLSGLDKQNNNVYIINDTTPTNTDYTIKTGISDWENKNIRLEGNNNSIVLKKQDITQDPIKPGIRLIKYGYDAQNINDNTIIKSILPNINKEMKIDGYLKEYKLKSKKLSMTINRNTETNKNEFVSVALVINRTFKIWLKPESMELNYKYICDFDEISDSKLKLTGEDKDICQLYKYRNGKFMDNYDLNFAYINNTSLTDILYVSYNNKLLNYNTNTNILDLGETPVSDNYSIKFTLSEGAYIVFENKKIADNILQLSKKKETIEFSVVNGNKYKHYKINLNYGTVVKSSDLNLFESRYLLHLSINEAYDYLNQVNKDERTIAFLIKKHDLDKKDDVQQFLNLILDKSKRATIESGFINSLNNADRKEYIKKYMILKNIPVVPTTKTSDTKSAVTEKDIMLNNLKLKLDKMRIEKEILANRYKVEQQNKVLAQRSANLVKKTDMTKLDKEMDKISGVLNKADTDKSDSFFDKVFSIFSSSDEDKKEKEETKIKKTQLELIKEARESSLKNPSTIEYDKLKKEKTDLQKTHDELKKKQDDLKKKQEILKKAQEKKIKEHEEKLKKQEEKLKTQEDKLKKQEEELKKLTEKNTDNLNKAEKEKEKLEEEKAKLKAEKNKNIQEQKIKIQNQENKKKEDKLFNIQDKLMTKQNSILDMISASTSALTLPSMEQNIKTIKNLINNPDAKETTNPETGITTTIVSDAKTGVTTETSTNPKTGDTKTIATDKNTGVTTVIETESKTGITKTTTTDKDTGIVTIAETDTNTGIITTTTTDPVTGITTKDVDKSGIKASKKTTVQDVETKDTVDGVDETPENVELIEELADTKEVEEVIKNEIMSEMEDELTTEQLNDEINKKIAKEKQKMKKETVVKIGLEPELKKKKKKKPCVSFMDCYFKNLDDNFYTSYKNDYTYIKNAELPKNKKPVCKPKTDCNICYLNTDGVPKSVNYNKMNSQTTTQITDNTQMVQNSLSGITDIMDTNSYNMDNIDNKDNKDNKEANKDNSNLNERFTTDYTDLPECPFDPCMSCNDNNDYKLFNNAFSDKLIEKYGIKNKKIKK